jgi:hypothetical protein
MVIAILLFDTCAVVRMIIKTIVENDFKTCYKYLLLNPADVFQEIANEARSVILAGGTMEPMTEFRQQVIYHEPCLLYHVNDNLVAWSYTR